jgi:hypothetical protein
MANLFEVLLITRADKRIENIGLPLWLWPIKQKKP